MRLKIDLFGLLMADSTSVKIRDYPWVSLGLFCLTYGIFGLLIGDSAPEWQNWILNHQNWFAWDVDEAIALQMVYGFGALCIFLLMILFTAPLKIVQVLFGSWLRSDTKAVISVLFWALTAVLVMTWLHHFARAFVLISAGILCHLDLQLCGCRVWQVFVVLTILSLGSYAIGVYGSIL